MGFNNAMGMALQQSLQRARQLQDQYVSPAARGMDAPAARWAAFGGGPADMPQAPPPPPVPGPVQEPELNVPGLRNMRERVDLPMPSSMPLDDDRVYMQNPTTDAYRRQEPDQPLPSQWADQLSRFKSQDISAYPPSTAASFRTSRGMDERYGRTPTANMMSWGGGQAQAQPEMRPRSAVQQPGRQAQWAPPRQRQSTQPRYQAGGRQGNGFMGGGQMKRGGF